jgi:DNA-directed RNA polymerase subunit E'/Rpb7
MQTIFIDDQIALTPIDLNDPENIRLILEEKLRSRYEGRCNASGYIQPGSIALLTKSMGLVKAGEFTGNTIFQCRASCKIYIPVANSVLNVKIRMMNEMGAYSVLAGEGEEDAMRILLPRDMHRGNTIFEALAIGQVVSVKLLLSRFQTNDTYIDGVAHLHAEESKKDA